MNRAYLKNVSPASHPRKNTYISVFLENSISNLILNYDYDPVKLLKRNPNICDVFKAPIHKLNVGEC